VYSGAMKLTDSVDNSPIDAGKLVLSQQELCSMKNSLKAFFRCLRLTVLAVRKKFYILLK
jgi:hypothetical protein